MKIEHYQLVEKFMVKAGQNTPQEITDLTPEERVLRARLIWEEVVKELIMLGLGVDVMLGDISLMDLLEEEKPYFAAVNHFNLKETIDGCMDGAVVITGTLVAMGVPDKPFQDEVDRNNLAKFGPGGHRDEETGKWIKPPGHQPPDITGILQKLRNTVELEKRNTSNNEAVRYDYAPEGLHFYHPVHQRSMLLVTDEDHGYYGHLLMELKTDTGSAWQVGRKATAEDKEKISQAFDAINQDSEEEWLKPTIAL